MDPAKATANRQKHGVSFNEAASVFGDPLSITVHDPDHSDAEDRFVVVGTSVAGHLMIVSFAERAGSIRIIGARRLTRAEQEDYGTGQFD